MKTYTIDLTEVQRTNLLAFLERASLRGTEVDAFNDLVVKLRTATGEEMPVPTPKK